MALLSAQEAEKGIHPDFIKSAGITGISLAVLIEYVVEYGLPILCTFAQQYNWPIPAGLCTKPLPPLPPPTPAPTPAP